MCGATILFPHTLRCAQVQLYLHGEHLCVAVILCLHLFYELCKGILLPAAYSSFLSCSSSCDLTLKYLHYINTEFAVCDDFNVNILKESFLNNK